MNTHLSETDARRKWCPFVRYSKFDGEAANNRSADFLDDAKRYCCIASGCMAWRWVDDLDPKRGGYCGLAGS